MPGLLLQTRARHGISNTLLPAQGMSRRAVLLGFAIPIGASSTTTEAYKLWRIYEERFTGIRTGIRGSCSFQQGKRRSQAICSIFSYYNIEYDAWIAIAAVFDTRYFHRSRATALLVASLPPRITTSHAIVDDDNLATLPRCESIFFGNGTTAAEAAERREATDTVENTEPRMDKPA